MKKLVFILLLSLITSFCFADYDDTTDMQTITGSAAFTQTQNNFKAMSGSSGTPPTNLSTKNILLQGATSGTITLTPPAAAGTTAITVPALAGTLVTTAGAGANVNLGAYTLTNSVSTGTAPFTVASTTVSTNLNADLLDGKHGDAQFGTTASRDIGTVYQAASDGFVTARAYKAAASSLDLIGYTDANADPTGTDVAQEVSIDASTASGVSITFPVRKNDYYKVTLTGTTDASAMYFTPLGA